MSLLEAGQGRPVTEHLRLQMSLRVGAERPSADNRDSPRARAPPPTDCVGVF